jgi:hypothetical protein
MPKLFVVPKQPIAPGDSEPDEIEEESFVLSGDVKTDLETALLAVAFLLDFVDCVGSDGLRCCANEIREFRKERP